ncbi:Rieske (2Fe-2S) protein [Actinomadura sp. LCR2-06]|uniref:Rieske (2Fe-2S) protein n=2 Tax=Actinomadura violacea TaxID=2819934 RepID=A0ABS3S3U5_9ACTN|nr:Rieske (2Fe-2S) protein [Actinomadura violacea]
MRTLDRLEESTALDSIVEPAQKVARTVEPGRFRDALHGVWLGHPLHPALVQLPIGAWASAGVLDLFGDDQRAVRRLVAFGLAGAVPAALAGSADWSEQHEQQMRVGVVHAFLNGTATALYAASLLTRTRRTGRALRLAGLLAAGTGGLLGGRISFRQAGGANHAESVPHLVDPGWQELGALDELPQDEPGRRMLGEIPVVVVRRGTEVHVLADRCSHLSGPLSDGEVKDGRITCPWHGSTFDLAGGSVACGPATAPQPVFDTEIRSGTVWVRLPGAG